MTIDTSYQDQFPFLFAGNAGTIRISASPNEEIPIKLQYIKTRYGSSGGSVVEYETSFTMKAGKNGSVSLPLDSIVRCLQPILRSVSSNAGSGQYRPKASSFLRITFGDGDDAVFWDKEIYPGTVGYDFLKDVYEQRCFLTARPQIGLARTDGQTDDLALSPDGTTVFAFLYFDIIAPVKTTVASGLRLKPALVSVSYDNIRAIADETGYSGYELKAYDVWMETEMTDDDGNVTSVMKSEVLRFIVPNHKVSMFEFLSSVGAIEPIYAAGSKKSEVETETRTFVNDGVERELTNDSRLVHETFTGWLASADEVRFWREFFSSAERYAVIDGVSREIIIDEIDSESTAGELNAFSFKWHYADKYADPARTPVRKELKQYNPTI